MSEQIPAPGTVIPISTRVSPGGARGLIGLQGIQGLKGPPGPLPTTITEEPFYVPIVGATVEVVVEDPRWMAIGQMVYVENAAGDLAAGAFQVHAITGRTVTLLNPVP